MSITDYKETIKKIIDSTDNEVLLKHWKNQLEWDIKHETEIELSENELNLVQEGLADYENGNILSLEEFIAKRK
ncbi:MAG: hypothetical protein ACR2FN_12290 [Chitinophagaceae bacterium]